MRPLLLSALFISMLALGACDSGTTEEPPPPPLEELVPVSFEYRVDASQENVSDFGIRYTDEGGEEVIVPTAPPFAFPFVEILDPLPVEARGPYSVRFFGSVQSGGVVVRVRAFRDGLLVATSQVSTEAGGAVDLTATLTIGPDGEIIEE